jgi:hypothetical protein
MKAFANSRHRASGANVIEDEEIEVERYIYVYVCIYVCIYVVCIGLRRHSLFSSLCTLCFMCIRLY